MHSLVCCFLIILPNFHLAESWQSFERKLKRRNTAVEDNLFSKETLLQHIQSPEHQEYLKFDCKNKAEGTYVESSTDCTLYHICENSTRIGANQKLTSFQCPPGTRFHIQSLKCVWWDDVVCDDGFSALTLKPKPKPKVPTIQAKQRRRNKRRLNYRNNLLRNDFTLPTEAFGENNPSQVAPKIPYSEQPPYECYWCCKPRESSRPIIVPATPKPVTEEAFSWTPYPPATRPTNNPVAVWKPDSSSTQRPGDSFTWIPALTTASWWTPKPVLAAPTLPPSVPISQIQILEISRNNNKKEEADLQEDCSKRDSTPGAEILLKFERYPPLQRPLQSIDDAIVIENDQERLPTIIEAKTNRLNKPHYP